MAILFFVASAACLIIGPQVHPMARAAGELQITLTSAAATATISLVWLLLTFVFGRIYCAMVCPIGALSDFFTWIRRKSPRLNKPFKYRPQSQLSVHIMWIYIVCVVAGVAVVPFLIEPWNMTRNMAAAVNPDAVSMTWTAVGRGVLTGVLGGVAAFLLIALTSLRRGRDFCTTLCPIGTALGYVQGISLTHVEINTDICISCGHCEEVCRAQCIKSVSRHIDQRRCVRCLDCVAECPSGAIRIQINRNRPATPLMRKVKDSTKA